MTDEFLALMRQVRAHLVSFRLTLKLTVKEAATRASLSRGGLEKIESGENLPSLESLHSICKVYGVSMAEFFWQVQQQQHVSANLRNDFQKDMARLGLNEPMFTPAATPEPTQNQLKTEIFCDLARKVGLEQEMQLACELAVLRKKNQELYDSLVRTISCLVTDRRKSRKPDFAGTAGEMLEAEP